MPNTKFQTLAEKHGGNTQLLIADLAIELDAVERRLERVEIAIIALQEVLRRK